MSLTGLFPSRTERAVGGRVTDVGPEELWWLPCRVPSPVISANAELTSSPRGGGWWKKLENYWKSVDRKSGSVIFVLSV
jgi:hypothetical protein